ncbi:hypothetical protein SCHPADRAFT_895565 [Schizopora paradoxa]|uniref:Uncharacterized protein n=1 Tax=Schizopora paradoxa TaxID=27342 RepID=A0A0H2R384_9AGAM|nr:hypothetical protein SCHPADRAFT_895565 [Schizopora paradoxa]
MSHPRQYIRSEARLSVALQNVSQHPSLAARRALDGSMEHGLVVARNLKTIPRTFHSALVRMYARWLTALNGGDILDENGQLEVAAFDTPIHALHHMKRPFFESNPAAVSAVTESLPILRAWLSIAVRCIIRNQRLSGFPDGRVRVMLRALNVFVIMRRIGENGSQFIAEHHVYNTVTDLWLQTRGQDTREDKILSAIFMELKNEYINHNSGSFLQFIFERADARGLGDTIIDLQLSRLDMALSCDEEHNRQYELSIDAHLATLYALVYEQGFIGTPRTHKGFIVLGGVQMVMKLLDSSLEHSMWLSSGYCLAIVANILGSSRSQRCISIALTANLVQHLSTGTRAFDRLQDLGRSSIQMLLRDILPDFLLFRSIIKLCDGLNEGGMLRPALRNNSHLKEDWDHLFALYDFRLEAYRSAPRLDGRWRTCGHKADCDDLKQIRDSHMRTNPESFQPNEGIHIRYESTKDWSPTTMASGDIQIDDTTSVIPLLQICDILKGEENSSVVDTIVKITFRRHYKQEKTFLYFKARVDVKKSKEFPMAS